VLSIEPRPRAKTPFEALRRLLHEQLDQIYAHDPGTRLGTDPESVHDMRVAARRSRALLRAGAPLVETDTQELSVELQWLGSVLGAVRDLDVLLARLRDEAAALDPSDRAAAGRLLRALERQRTRARRTLLKALDSERYDALLDRFEELVTTLEPTASKATLGKLAERELDRLRRDVKALDEEPEDAALHGLRKRGKRVRYAYELAGAKAVVKRAKAFQDVLGEHQDSVVAEERLRAISQDAPADQALAAGLLIERERARRARARASWRKVWRELERAAR
jgi:CHAD domain-containing protein